MTTYNGHRSWAAWNVALWIGNDEGLYRLALDCLARASARKDKAGERRLRYAAALFVLEVGAEKTPDGARYSLRSTREALAGLES